MLLSFSEGAENDEKHRGRGTRLYCCEPHYRLIHPRGLHRVERKTKTGKGCFFHDVHCYDSGIGSVARLRTSHYILAHNHRKPHCRFLIRIDPCLQVDLRINCPRRTKSPVLLNDGAFLFLIIAPSPQEQSAGPILSSRSRTP